ncbi:MAG: antibiotic biosynthesis monooxygenase, partial [Sulfurovum sp.]|nr:antibiotic biosynthesis monooxygenase [Sulfurovaceae bacterium]
MAITKQVTFIAKDEKIKELKDLLIGTIDASKAEPGCLFYYIHQ